MDDPQRPGELLDQLRAGNSGAAAQLFARYARRLSTLAQQHLSQQLASRVDGDDVVQSVFRSFFDRCARGEFQIDSSANLWRLLVQITIRKARTHGRHHTAGMRDVAAEADDREGHWLVQSIARDPDPAEAIALVDEIRHLLAGLPARHGQVLEMRLAGCDIPEIARKLDVSRQTVYRVLDLLQQRLQAAGSSA